uniref:Cadherin domain-containing protein n=1 Tax=Esox lucius TaxID=8010 RepID=A0AAY5K9P4_ESOLU
MAVSSATVSRMCVTVLFVFSAMWGLALSISRYSIPEEMQEGSVVANLATDLGLDVRALVTRKAKLDIIHSKKYLDINKETGELFILEKIDREYICSSKTTSCFLKMDVIFENPIRIFNIELEIMDINDNAPVFRRETMHLDISESTAPGERFSLTNAVDADVGANSIKTYYLSTSKSFTIDIQTGSDGSKYVDLVLNRNLDREEQALHNLILTAVDGGVPARSGTASIIVRVLDINDNAPLFNHKQLYKVPIPENAPNGATIVIVSATDLDEGLNGEIVYSLPAKEDAKHTEMFSIDPRSGVITSKGTIDYEENAAFEIRVQAKDRGLPPRSTQCKVLVEVIDVNDNAPEIVVTSVMATVKEDSFVGTVIASINALDKDGGKNGHVVCTLVGDVPFKLISTYNNYYSVAVDRQLDRESVSQYNVTISAKDEGTPPLSSTTVIKITVSDVNDNPPRFSEPIINVFVKENIPAGALIVRLTASDHDVNDNAQIAYSMLETSNTLPTMININSLTGEIYSMHSFNYEGVKKIQFQVQATDSGVPPLSSNVTVNVFILDENDNSPVILPPYSDPGSVHSENIPYSAERLQRQDCLFDSFYGIICNTTVSRSG